MQMTVKSKCGGKRLKGITAGASTPPLLSVITVIFNGFAEIEPTILSVLNQSCNDLECIVIDGGSTDGTVDLIRKYEDHADYWLSEPDTGIYDAMNKGVATAEYLLHLNVGDSLLSLLASELTECLQEKVNVAAFRVQLEGGLLHIPKGSGFMRIRNVWHHQGTCYRRKAHLGYDTAYRVFGDFDHNQRLARTTDSVRISNQVIASHENAGVSTSKKHFGEVYRSVPKNG
jgi:glycosyltransferase involved in cell wall biosynthesis